MTIIKTSLRLAALSLVALFTACSPYHQMAAATPQYASVKQGQMEYYRLGKGSPIVLIPGYATDVTSWDNDFLHALAQHHELIILNNRNVAGSRINSKSYLAKDLADDTSNLMRALKIKHATVLGISMGGMIAQEVAIRHPDQVKSLVLINTAMAGKQAVHPTPEMENRLLNLPTSQLGFYSLAVHSFFPSGWRMKMAYSLAANRFLPYEYERIDIAKIMPAQRKLILTWADDDASAAALKKLSMPTLILNGEADQVIPPVNSQLLANSIKHAKLIRWKEGGHAMIYQFPKQMATAINKFLLT